MTKEQFKEQLNVIKEKKKEQLNVIEKAKQNIIKSKLAHKTEINNLKNISNEIKILKSKYKTSN